MGVFSMSEFRRIITYLYLYEEGVKGRNIGFAKVEKREQRCLLEIHMKNTGYSLSPIPVYFYVQKNNQFVGILLGKFTLTRGNGEFKIVLNAEDLSDSTFSLDVVKGIYIPLTERTMMVSQWDDDEFHRERFIDAADLSDINQFSAQESQDSMENTTSSASKAQTPPESSTHSYAHSSNLSEEPKHIQLSEPPSDTLPMDSSKTESLIKNTENSKDYLPLKPLQSSDNRDTSSSIEVPQHTQNSNSPNEALTVELPQSTENSDSFITAPEQGLQIAEKHSSSDGSTTPLTLEQAQSDLEQNLNAAEHLKTNSPFVSSRQAAPNTKTTDALKALEALPRRESRTTGFRSVSSGNHTTNTNRSKTTTPPHSDDSEDWALRWRFILENYPVMTPFSGDEDTLCVRLELKDLRQLPRQFWYLGNNSFLLHGFFNYRYLILGMTQEFGVKKWFIGIPGVFQNPERVMAALFGFPEFRREKPAPINTGEFGYWYRYLNELTQPAEKSPS